MTQSSLQLPGYTDPAIKNALLAAGVTGTIYALVMPESEAALAAVIDDPDSAGGHQQLLDRYREPWTQKQDAAHETFFARWTEWVAPIVTVNRADFVYSYPTAGASEGIFKVMAEYVVNCRKRDAMPTIHIFDGDYEGFPAFAAALGIEVKRHNREEWADVAHRIDRDAQFWISHPSAIDGSVWTHFDAFAALLAERRPDIDLVPDLTYVGSVATPFRFSVNHANISAIIFSHSKPFGGYYHRVGGVMARRDYPSLFGNKWFKNLLSLAWGSEMMARHDVFALPSKYAAIQATAAERVADRLGIAGFKPADVSVLATAPACSAHDELLRSVLRGTGDERCIRLCLTPLMSSLIDPALAPMTVAQWQEAASPNNRT